MKETSRLKTQYLKVIAPELKKELNIANVMAIPTIEKIVINSGLGEAKIDKNIIDEMVADMALIAGQKPVVTMTKKAISNFKIRENMPIGAMVTLRGEMMWYFLDRLISIVLPRIKDFRGISPKAFDGRGNYAIGIKEHTVFPEVDPTKVGKIRGLQVIIRTTAKTDERALLLLTKLGMPFQKKK
jgi:large subunit ribosomal protein L5